MGTHQHCPICSAALRPSAAYPRHLCGNCASEARSADGRPLAFFNVDMSGGYRAEYADTREPYESHACYVKGVRCFADEARMGGIVIEVMEERGTAEAVREDDGASIRPVSTVADRARGVLVGLAVGDALGAPVEFESPAAIAGRRAELFSMPGGGTFGWAPGEFTDDTQMALVVAHHLRDHCGTVEQDELAQEFAGWAKDAADVGNQTRAVLDAVSRGVPWSEAILRLAADAAGNGSLMRVAPVALVAASAEVAEELAEAQSAVTHPNGSCVEACRFFARLLWSTIARGELDIEGAAAGLRIAEVRRAVLASTAPEAPQMSGWVLTTLTGALWAVRGAESFEDAVWRAVALGQDADTVGAVAGALAGARWGLSSIPRVLSEQLQSQHPMFKGSYPAALIHLVDDLVTKRSLAQREVRQVHRTASVAEAREVGSNQDICDALIRAGVIRAGAWLHRVPQRLEQTVLSSRVRGMLLGVAIGDALGNTSESMHPAAREQAHGEIRDYLPHRHAEAHWPSRAHRSPSTCRRVGLPSDDTQLTFRTVEHLLDERRLRPVGMLERFASQNIFGVGSATREALALFRAGARDCSGVKSAGNGGLMRIVPILFPHLAKPGPELWLDAVVATAATHGDSMAIASSVAWTNVLWELLASKATPAPEFWLERFADVASQVEAAEQRYRPRGGSALGFDGSLSQYLDHWRPVFSQPQDVRTACQLWYSGAYLLETIPSVLYILSRHADDPEQAMIRAVNDTWDNDTIASIVGGALGALHGPDAFPARWVDGLLGRTAADDDGRVFELIDAAVKAFASS